MKKEDLRALLAPHGQEQVLAFWDRLDEAARENLAAQVCSLDLDRIAELYAHRDQPSDAGQLAARAAPPPAFRLDATQNRFTPQQARQRGTEALDAGQVAAMLVAGGQGTRLGFDHPKGMFPIGPVTGRTLFQIHLEKVLAMGRRHGRPIPLYVMTSPATHDETLDFFARHKRFGLREEDVRVFCQGTMPAVDAQTGKLLLESPGQLAVSPDGHGGMLAAFSSRGMLDDARRRGIRQVFYWQVDNPLVEVCGVEYVGYHLLCESEMTTQVVAKRDPLERVGNVVEIGGRLMVIEYSELPAEAGNRRNPNGSLAIWAGSIAVHVFDLAFLERMAATAHGLPFHLASKRVAYVDPATGHRIEPEKPNAIKFERFIFDLMPSARNAIVVEVDPARAFAPLKNASGSPQDTPESVRAQMTALYHEWLHQAGADVAEGVPLEISPLVALDAQELAQRLGGTSLEALGGTSLSGAKGVARIVLGPNRVARP